MEYYSTKELKALANELNVSFKSLKSKIGNYDTEGKYKAQFWDKERVDNIMKSSNFRNWAKRDGLVIYRTDDNRRKITIYDNGELIGKVIQTKKGKWLPKIYWNKVWRNYPGGYACQTLKDAVKQLKACKYRTMSYSQYQALKSDVF